MLRHFYFGGGKRLIDHTTPTTVVNAAYDTSGNGGRKLVRLDNGWLVCGVVDTTSQPTLRIYVSKNNGNSFEQLCYMKWGGFFNTEFSITNNGNAIYVIWAYYDINLYAYEIDAVTQDNVDLGLGTIVDSTNQTSIGDCSLTIDSNGHLHAAWASKNITYPNSFNIRYSKSMDGGATWATPTQLTMLNNSIDNLTNPCIIIGGDNYPHIVFQEAYSTAHRIFCTNYNGSSWSVYNVIYNSNNGSYTQSNPSAVVDSNGVIHVTWFGKDATDITYNNIRYSKSTDNGATWSTMTKLTTGNIYDNYSPSVTIDDSNNVYVLWEGKHSGSTTYYQIRQIVYTSSWGSITNITANTVGAAISVSSLINYTNFENPLIIYKDNQNARVAFYGKFYVD